MALLSDKLIDSIPTSSIQEHKLANNSVSFRTLAQDTKDYIDNSTSSNSLNSAYTVTVGAGANYSTLIEAVTEVSKLGSPVVSLSPVRVTIEMQAGYVIQEQIICDGINLGFIDITGVDSATTVSDPFLVRGFSSETHTFYPFLAAVNGGVTPRLSTNLTLGSWENKHSTAVLATRGGYASTRKSSAVVINAFDYPVVALNGGHIYSEEVTITNTLRGAFLAHTNSTIACRNSTIDEVILDAFYALHNSSIQANSSVVTNVDRNVIQSYSNSDVSFRNATATLYNGTNAVYAHSNAKVDISGSTFGTDLTQESSASATLYAREASTINAYSCQLARGSDAKLARCRFNSFINLRSSRRIGGTSLSGYCSVLGGGIISVWNTLIPNTHLIVNDNPNSVLPTGVSHTHGIFFDERG